MYGYTKMGATATKVLAPTQSCFIIDRILAANCDFLPKEDPEPTIIFGVLGQKSDSKFTTNPLGHQGIRLGSKDKIHRMMKFSSEPNSIHYTFEDDVHLTVFKRGNNMPCYLLKTPEVEVTRAIDPVIANFYKKISMGDASIELDKLEEILK